MVDGFNEILKGVSYVIEKKFKQLIWVNWVVVRVRYWIVAGDSNNYGR